MRIAPSLPARQGGERFHAPRLMELYFNVLCKVECPMFYISVSLCLRKVLYEGKVNENILYDKRKRQKTGSRRQHSAQEC